MEDDIVDRIQTTLDTLEKAASRTLFWLAVTSVAAIYRDHITQQVAAVGLSSFPI